MNRFSLVVTFAVFAAACQKQQTDEERRAEVERQVQERLAAEHQQQQAQELAQREESVNAREQALNTHEQTTPVPQATVAGEETSRAEPASSYSMFYSKLEPYGDWMETGDYGYVYRPREAENGRWRPYTNGQWVYTDAGWTWVSQEPFGWATYHYGRWARIGGIGWVWVPGTEWAPAWVSWRKGGQYVGWAPLPPEAHFDRATGIRNWSDNYYDIGPGQYVFVPTVEFGEQRIERAIVPEQQNVSIVNQTTNVTNITYNNSVVVNEGPNYEEVRALSRAPLQRLRLERDAAVPAANAHAVIRSDAVVIPAPSIAPVATQQARPATVKQMIKQAKVERGWNAASSPREVEQARAKMKAEATPPPNAPMKKFVKPPAAANAMAAPSATLAGTPTPPAMKTPAAPAMPRRPQAPSPAAPVSSPVATIRPSATPVPAATPPSTPAHSATPASSPRMTSPAPPVRLLPSASPSASGATATPAVPQPRGEKGRQRRRENRAAPSGSPSSTPL